MNTRTSGRMVAFDRVILLNAMVWAATIFVSAVVAKASDQFLYVLIVLVNGALLSSAVLMAGGLGRRHAQERSRA